MSETSSNARMLLDSAAKPNPVIVLPNHVRDDLTSLLTSGDAAVLRIVVALVRSRETLPPPIPQKFTLTSLIRWADGTPRTGHHGSGNAADIGGMDFTAADPRDVVVTEALDHGVTRIGLPFQGQFFPQSATCADGAPPPASGCLRLDRAVLFKPDGEHANQAKTLLANASLKALFASYPSVLVFPDRENHVHMSVA